MTSTRFEELLKSAEHHHEQYLKNLRLLFDIPATSTRAVRTGSNDVTASPLLKAVSFGPTPPQSNGGRMRWLTNESPKVKPASVYEGLFLSGDEPSEFSPLTPLSRTASAKAHDSSVRSVSNLLPQKSFSEENLVAHIRTVDEGSQGTVTALGDVWQRRNELEPSTILGSFESGEGSCYESATYVIYEIGKDGIPQPKQIPLGPASVVGLDWDGDNGDASVWSVLKDINSDGKAVGRITILQEPSPLTLAATHLTLKDYFDMNELCQHLVSTEGNKGKTKAYVNRAFEADPIRQRSFFFVFKYYTVVGEGLTPGPWQAYDDRPPDRRSPDHIDLAECSSVLALSLGGEPTGTVKVKVRRKARTGVLYDTFAPWQLLNIQCFPDDEHSMRSDNSRKNFCNGPYAFLDALCVEYRDAVKRYTQVNEMITKLITPPNQFMFDVRLRDKLLFEDSHFTYSRRYFWAYNTLGVINEGIRSMRAAYLTTFTKDFWAGRHPTLWPYPPPPRPQSRSDSSTSSLEQSDQQQQPQRHHQKEGDDDEDNDEECRGQYLARMDVLRQELESAVAELQVMHDKNEATRTEIRSLREQLFSGSSVKESRRAIEQGDNIKILTSVSMVFLPLTFVVGVFGITTFDISATDWRFPVTLVSVCIPFFILILVLQTRAAMELVRRCGLVVERYLRRALSYVFAGGGAAAAAIGGSGGTGGGAGGGGGDRRHQYLHSYYQHHNHHHHHAHSANIASNVTAGDVSSGSGGQQGDTEREGRQQGDTEREGRQQWRRRLRMARAARREWAGAGGGGAVGRTGSVVHPQRAGGMGRRVWARVGTWGWDRIWRSREDEMLRAQKDSNV